MNNKFEILWKSAFKDDYKREKRGKYRDEIDILLGDLINNLTQNSPLPPRYNDHKLSGKWVGFRECHLKPNLLVIYRKASDDLLELYRLESHSELRLV